MTTLSTYLPYAILVGSIVVILTIMFGLRQALANSDWSESDRTAAWRWSAAVLVGWFLVSLAFSLSGAYQSGPERIPTIQYAIAIPILIGAWLIWRSPSVNRLIDIVPQPWIIAVQFYRVLGVTFLIYYAAGQMPGLFALPAGTGDIIVGLLAPIVALAYARDPGRNAGLVRGWNIFGILDLVVALTTGLITSPSALFAYEPPNQLIAAFPLVLVPIYLVPLAILLHLATLVKLHRENSHGRRSATGVQGLRA
jgi:hypothetical protein